MSDNQSDNSDYWLPKPAAMSTDMDLPEPVAALMASPFAQVTKHTDGRMEIWEVESSPYLDTAISCDYVYTANQLRAALAAQAQEIEALRADAQPAEPANTPYDEGPFTLTEPAGLSETELPPPQLLVESAQGFVEGWTKSQVRSAINLALLKHRYSQPAEPAALTDEEIDELIRKFTADKPAMYLAMCYESGPYDITKVRHDARDLCRAIERAIRSKA